ncbi:hypothetical protein SNEBB_004030 [Seison nebaliae]|nr:hypothetical protein SNEBB_004030 [Seison nebaliae]
MDGRLQKMEIDYREMTDEKIEKSEKLVNEKGKEGLKESLEMLVPLEKLCRIGNDVNSLNRIIVAIVQCCCACNDWQECMEQMTVLTKRRNQTKAAVINLIQEVIKNLKSKLYEKKEEEELLLKVIDVIRTVTKGKIYVENERAEVTKKMAEIEEKNDNLEKANEVMQELQVETYGSMERKEKVHFILEQMRLALLRHDYIRAQVISKKISKRFFTTEDDTDELKLTFYRQMIQMDCHFENYFNVFQHYQQIYMTDSIKQIKDKTREILMPMTTFLLLASFDNQQTEMIHYLTKDKHMSLVPTYKNLLSKFRRSEIIDWKKLCEELEDQLKNGHKKEKATGIFTNEKIYETISTTNAPITAVPSQSQNKKNGEMTVGEYRWNLLKHRVVEHNLRCVAKYYSNITIRRLSELLDVDEESSEKALAELVISGVLAAKINRSEKNIKFLRHEAQAPETTNDVSHINDETSIKQLHQIHVLRSDLNGEGDGGNSLKNIREQETPKQILEGWNRNLQNLMAYVNETRHLINKEEMIHTVR